MTNLEKFQAWAEDNDAVVEVIQEDDGSGYTVVELRLPHLWDGAVMEVTVNE
jgi:hypothetical protein